MFCNNCGNELPDATIICPICGRIIATTNSNYDFNTYLSDEITLDDLKLFVGTEKLPFYLTNWEAYLEDKKSIAPTWNWPGFLFTLFWLAFRKMYLFSFLYYSITFLIILICPVGIESLLSLIFYAFIGMYGNKLYFIHCRRKIKKIKSSSSTEEEVKLKLESTGGCSIVAPLLLITVGFIISIFL